MLDAYFTTFAELRAESTTVVRATAGRAEVERVNDIPFTLTQVSLNDVIAGAAPPATFTVSQLGGPDVASPNSSQRLAEQRQYLLFLKPSMTGDPTRFMITGDQGVYELTGDTYGFVGATGSALPNSLPATSATALVKG
ncbi:hypothetical protein AB0A74_00070 [Saccharothrix sp. NPDC042600]|uniref:hypothetical protein n=1 Tax=Saccharothrix TaxID=2071 RepID=UPI0033D38C3A|nr:hypothetical protein GCM10017745_46810 [Saccharothrix mutabilis subsp. capreolus]